MFVSGCVCLGLLGCVGTPERAGSQTGAEGMAPIAPGGGIDDYVLVDCLLPGQIRQLGTRMTFMAPRRMVKSTKTDCGIRGGEFVLFDRSDYGGALRELLPKAQGGDPVAQTYVGEIHEKGLGLPGPDYVQAASWYLKAAQQGHGPAQVDLGSLYERGLGVPKDMAQALEWYRLASGLTEDRLIFESTLKAQQAEFRREIALRNQVASALRRQLQHATARPRAGSGAAAQGAASSTPKVATRTAPSVGGTAKPVSRLLDSDLAKLQRQVVSQRLDAESEAERLRKELHAVDQLRKSETGVGRIADSGKSAQLGKLELARSEQVNALLDTSRRLSQAD